MNVVIVAGGLQTRFKELSCIPKVLLPSDNGKTILERQYEYFDGMDTITLVVNEKFYEMTKGYVEVNHLNVDVVKSSNTNGSANTLASVYDWIPKKNVLFFWSDILFEDDKFEVNTPDESCVVYTVDDKCYRYSVENGKIVNRTLSYDGNVPGIFYLKNVSDVLSRNTADDNLDLIDLIKSKADEGMITVSEGKIDAKIVEYKSLEEYEKIMSKSDVLTKFPTDIDITYDEDEDMVIESNSTVTDNKLVYWEDFASTLLHTVDCSDFTLNVKTEMREDTPHYKVPMSALEGYDVFDYKDDKQRSKLMEIANKMSKYSVEVPLGKMVHFVLKEWNGNPIKSVTSVSKMLVGYDFVRLQTIVDKLSEMAMDNSDMGVFALTHGNINARNVMYNKTTDDMVLINPLSRLDNKMYAPMGVDDADLAITFHGIDEKLRHPITQIEYPFSYDLQQDDDLTRALVILRLLSVICWFKDDIIKMNAIYNYCIVEATKLIYND